jgi:hypothetical protein
LPICLRQIKGQHSTILNHVYSRVKEGKKITKNNRWIAESAAKKGWLIQGEDGDFSVAPPPQVDPDLIWLPNELVTSAAHETPPLELVRQMQDVMTLRLLIDMYHVHNLRENGGVSRHCMWKKYDRVKVNERTQFVVWGFRSAGEWVNWDNRLTSPHRRKKLTKEETKAGKNPGVDFFRRSTQLCDIGLFEWVPHSSRATTKAARLFTQSGAADPIPLRTNWGKPRSMPDAPSLQRGSSNGPRTTAFSSWFPCRVTSPTCR